MRVSQNLPSFSVVHNQASPDIIAFLGGLPLPKGEYYPYQNLSVVNQAGRIQEHVSVECTAMWADNSCKWLLIKGVVEKHEANQLSVICTDNEPRYNPKPAQLIADKIRIQREFDLVEIANDAFLSMQFANGICIEGLTVSAPKLNIHNPQITLCDSQYRTHFSQHKAVVTTLNQTGKLIINAEKHQHIEVQAQIDFWHNIDKTDIQITFCNPSPALHPNGQWDLGDPNSVLLNAVSLKLSKPTSARFELSLDHNHKAIRINHTASVVQHSSGKDNWQSINHVDADDKVPLKLKGYSGTIDEKKIAGDHASPVLNIIQNDQSWTLTPSSFWQTFPRHFYAKDDNVSISLLGAENAHTTELQPGEKARVSLVLGDENPIHRIAVTPEWVAHTQALPCFSKDIASPQLREIIELGLDGQRNFYAKREIIDQYGWRNFGELFADHECPEISEQATFISHYNNQYDPIYGMLCQWLRTQDNRWFELADELANHVATIDIYHTNDDKPEYAGGMFWHTDHYIKAYTATHRSYSNKQPSNVYDGHAGGGGPGGQHCYTLGLSLHYLLTGSITSKLALDSVSRWITHVYEGDKTLFSLLMSLKNRHNVGLKNPITGRYPLDRGTANYIHAQLDRYSIEGKVEQLRHVEHIILNTFDTNDHIPDRHLTNVEETWFYTVFLQSVCRYLSDCTKQGLHNGNTRRIVSALVHYATWMTEHEYAYLDKPDILEFPNQTWTAQDCRKVCVLLYTSHFVDEALSALMQSKANALLDTITQRLSESEEKDNTRILCLLMQNTDFQGYSDSGREAAKQLVKESSKHSEVDINSDTIAKTVFKTLMGFNVRYEWQQAKKRFARLR